MARNSITLLAATALTLGMATFVSAQGESDSDCPEDMNTTAGCQMENAEQSDRQPVEGAATAPVEATDQDGQGAHVMTGADTEGDGGDPTENIDRSSDDASGSAGSMTGGADPSGSGSSADGAIEGAATAPTSGSGQEGQGSATMSGPEGGDQDGGASDGGSSDGSSSGGESGSEGGSSDQSSSAAPSGHGEFAVAREEGGRYYTAEDTPTFNIADDGTVDWLTYSGFRRYHSECHVCHGPDGMGSSYAPALVESVQNMDYYDFYGVVVNGKQDVSNSQNQVMPAFGTNQNVMCYLDDIYVYLLARGVGDLPRGRPAKKEAKSDMIQEAENACMGA